MAHVTEWCVGVSLDWIHEARRAMSIRHGNQTDKGCSRYPGDDNNGKKKTIPCSAHCVMQK
jgi:hypothetical protein